MGFTTVDKDKLFAAFKTAAFTGWADAFLALQEKKFLSGGFINGMINPGDKVFFRCMGDIFCIVFKIFIKIAIFNPVHGTPLAR